MLQIIFAQIEVPEIGTQILGDGNVTVAAKNDVNIRQGVINSEHGATTIAAGNNVNIENGNTYSRDQYGLQYKEKGLLSRTVNTIRKDYEHTGCDSIHYWWQYNSSRS